MSGGGSTTVQKADPWSGAQPYLTDIMGQAQSLYSQGGPSMYPGQSFVGPTPGQIGGWDTQLNYADQVFGGQDAPQFGQATGALGNALAGNTTLGSMANSLSPLSTSAIGSSFSNPFGTAGGLDARGAIAGALSGSPDYSAVGNAVNAANTQQFNQLYNDVIPQLNQRASFLGNPSGAIKTLNSTLTNLTNNQNLNAQQAYLGEFNRAKAAQENAAGLVSQGGLSSQSNALGLGSLAGNLSTGANDAALRGVALFPSLVQTGSIPGQLASQVGDWGANFQNQALQDQINRYNYYQNLPQQNLQNYAGVVNGFGGLGGTQSSGYNPSGGQKVAGAAGGALAGAQMGSMFGPWGTAIGGILGGAYGAFSDRRLKTDIVRVGELPSGLALYSFRFHGSLARVVGVMADEVRELYPRAVTRDACGYDRVDYGALA